MKETTANNKGGLLPCYKGVKERFRGGRDKEVKIGRRRNRETERGGDAERRQR
jgi:hypothetical protein